MMPQRYPTVHVARVDAIALGLLSMSLTLFLSVTIFCAQKVAQRPATEGVMTVHLGRHGDLRVWNQPIRPHELSGLLERATVRSLASNRLVVRLIPDPTLPWGTIHRMLMRLQPHPHAQRWILQLQLP